MCDCNNSETVYDLDSYWCVECGYERDFCSFTPPQPRPETNYCKTHSFATRKPYDPVNRLRVFIDELHGKLMFENQLDGDLKKLREAGKVGEPFNKLCRYIRTEKMDASKRFALYYRLNGLPSPDFSEDDIEYISGMYEGLCKTYKKISKEDEKCSAPNIPTSLYYILRNLGISFDTSVLPGSNKNKKLLEALKRCQIISK